MPRFIQSFKRFLRKITCRQDIPQAVPSATDSTHVQQEQPGDSSPSSSPGHPQEPSSAQSLWDRAYDALAKENPDLVKKYDELLEKEQMANSSPSETTPLQHPAPHDLGTRSDRPRRQVLLNTVIQRGLQRMEENKTTYKIAGHEFVLADQITQVSHFLLWGKDWIGTAVKDSPEASLVWSGVCLIFPLLTNPITAAEANQDGFVYVTSRLRYYVALEPMVRRLGLNAGVDEALISTTDDHIVDLYQTILDFQLRSVLRFYQSRLKTFAGDIVTLKNWEQTQIDIKMREDTVNNDLDRINQLAARQELERLNNTSEKTNAAMESYLSVATQQLAVLKQQQAAQEDAKQERLLAKEQKCLQEFYLTKNGSGAAYDWYKGRVERRVDGTCNWFLQHDNYRKWLSQDSGPLLVSADPGCGKSVLAKYLIDHELAQQSATICYYFFKDQDQNTVRQALCALLHQLFSQNEDLIRHAMELYTKKGDKLVQSEESLWTILRDSVRDPRAGPVIFVIDALDECAESELGGLITILEDMFCGQQLKNAKFKVLMTSRPYQQVVSEFYSLQDVFPRIHIPGAEEFEAISEEINSVIHYRVEQLARKHWLSDKIKSSLSSKLLAIDHRTYLWVYLVFDYLDKGLFERTDVGIDAAIQKLPKSVNQAYDQILNRSQQDETVQIVKKALCIILAAQRPLTLSEMNIAMKLNGQGRGRSIHYLELEEDMDFKARLRTLCGLFVNIHHDKIYFLHQTAREFLIQSSAPKTVSSNLQWHRSITTRHAHSVLAEICIYYLDILNYTPAETFRKHDQYGAFQEYAVEYWGNHCREAEFEKGSSMVDLASKLCNPDLRSHSQWARIISGRYSIPFDSNVLIASDLGLVHVTELLLSKGADIETRGFRDRTALLYAVEGGHEAVTRLLLEKGANIEAKTNEGWTGLIIAAFSDREAVTRLLLENSADIEGKDNFGKTALIWAVSCGHEAVTRLLLEYGANVDASHGGGWTALMSAAHLDRHEAVTRLLLNSGADIEAKNHMGRTALMYAAESGQEVGARLLLDNGADMEAKDTDGDTALMNAAANGQEAVTRLLLENGANIEAKNNNGWTTLIHAAESGHEAVTRLLLENGANVDTEFGRGWTALMLAAHLGHEVVTRLLLENGANVEAKDNDGDTALMDAAKSGHEAVIRLLLENGANVEAKDNDGDTALKDAAKSGHEAVLRLLLENGANIEAKSTDGTTALMRAAKRGREAVTRMLLEKGADVEAKDNDGCTALMKAVGSGEEDEISGDEDEKSGDEDEKSGDEDVIRLLLEHGANIDAKDNKGWTARRYASGTAARLLLDYGAEVEANDVEGSTA